MRDELQVCEGRTWVSAPQVGCAAVRCHAMRGNARKRKAIPGMRARTADVRPGRVVGRGGGAAALVGLVWSGARVRGAWVFGGPGFGPGWFSGIVTPVCPPFVRGERSML